MKLFFLALLLLTLDLNAQEIKSRYNYKIEKISEGKYKTKVIGFDSLKGMEDFWDRMNPGEDMSNGELLVHDENGKKRLLAIYKDGIRVGKHLEWYPTGELRCETTWETDLSSSSRSYYKSGKISAIGVNENRDNAVYTEYYENGKTKTVTNYAEHFAKSYYKSGQIKTEKLGTKRTYKEWHPNGKLKVTGSLDEYAWHRIGKWLFYNDKGKLVKELIYQENNRGWYDRDEGYSKEIKH